MRDELTIAQLRFASEYVKTGDQEGAFQAAYNYSRRSSGYGNADRVMKKPEVFCEIMRLRAQLQEDLRLDRTKVLEGLCEIAFADDISAYLDYDNDSVSVRDLAELTPRQARAIKSVSIDPKTSQVKLEFHDRLQAFDKLARCLGLYQDINVNAEMQMVIRAPAPMASSAEWEAAAQAAGYALEHERAPPAMPMTNDDPQSRAKDVYATYTQLAPLADWERPVEPEKASEPAPVSNPPWERARRR